MSDTPALASRSPDTISRWRSAGTLGMAAPPSRSASICRHHRPAAARHDAFERLDRLLGVLRGRRRQRRQRRLRHLDGAGARIEALAVVVVEILVDQGFERGVLPECPRGHQAAARQRRRARELAQDRAPVGMAAVGRNDHCVPESRCRAAADWRPAAVPSQAPGGKLRSRGKARAGRICDRLPEIRSQRGLQTHQAPGGGNPGGLEAANVGNGSRESEA